MADIVTAIHIFPAATRKTRMTVKLCPDDARVTLSTTKLSAMQPEIRATFPEFIHMIGSIVAKGQKRSNREAKKPKKTAAERLKASQTAAERQVARVGDKNASQKG